MKELSRIFRGSEPTESDVLKLIKDFKEVCQPNESDTITISKGGFADVVLTIELK